MSSPEAVTKPQIRVHLGKVKAGFVAVIALAILAVPITVHATLPAWLQHIVGASTVESALYRVMPLPGIQALYPRPPREAQTELTHLIASTPDQAELYQLRARADEQSLDESAAEADWKLYTAHAPKTPSPPGSS